MLALAVASALAKSLTLKFFMWWARRCQASYPVPVTGLVCFGLMACDLCIVDPEHYTSAVAVIRCQNKEQVKIGDKGIKNFTGLKESSFQNFEGDNLDGWMTCDFMSFQTVFQEYQDDVWMIMNGCVQWNSIYDWEDFTSSEERTCSAKSVGQCWDSMLNESDLLQNEKT